MSSLGIAQRGHPLAGHPGADDLVVVEGHAASAEGAGLRLADVVEEGGQAQQPVGLGLVHHGQGVGEHVLVPVDRVLLERQAGQLGQEIVGQARSRPRTRAPTEGVDHQQLVQLVTDPLGRDDRQPVVTGLDRLDQLRVGRQAETGDEPGRPQHPQRVVGEGDLGVERGPQPPGGQVGEAVERVDELHLGQAQGHGVDGEVPAGEVVSMRSPKATSGLRESGW